MILRRITPATAYPVPDTDALEHLRLTANDETYLVHALVGSACDLIGEMSGRCLASEVWAASYSSISGKIKLPKSPVISVDSVTYYDQTDMVQSLPTTDFYVFLSDDHAEMQPKPGRQWPVTSTRDDAITITFTAGYAALPQALRAAVLLTVGHLYENRQASVVGMTVATLPLAVEELVSIHRLGWAAG